MFQFGEQISGILHGKLRRAGQGIHPALTIAIYVREL